MARLRATIITALAFLALAAFELSSLAQQQPAPATGRWPGRAGWWTRRAGWLWRRVLRRAWRWRSAHAGVERGCAD